LEGIKGRCLINIKLQVLLDSSILNPEPLNLKT
jgi:hypothetical protein